MKFIALGSNLSLPIDNLRHALKLLVESGFQILARAPVYQSAAVPMSDQPDFLNSVVRVEFAGTPRAALEICHQVEENMGRVRTAKNEARIIDLDILAWDGVVQSGPPELPHPRMHQRAFVMLPLSDIAPLWRHPVLKETATRLARALAASDIRKIAEVL